MFELTNGFYKSFLSKEIKIWFELPGFELTDIDCIYICEEIPCFLISNNNDSSIRCVRMCVLLLGTKLRNWREWEQRLLLILISSLCLSNQQKCLLQWKLAKTFENVHCHNSNKTRGYFSYR